MNHSFSFLSNLKRFLKWLQFRFSAPFRKFEVSSNPAFTPPDLEWFKQRIARTRFYLEFGSGGSTALVAQSACKLVSIESDRRFAKAVRQATPKGGQAKIVYADVGLVGAWGYPVFQLRTQATLKRWRTYTNSAKLEIENAGSFPDLVLVDGRFRVACALSIAAWVSEAKATTTIMFDDNHERAFYHSVETYLGKPALMPGRAAVFEIKDGKMVNPINPLEIELAHWDVR